MSPRPRETSDEEILAAAARVMQCRSPAELTLADVAREAGVVPATLIQRFGTKRGLLLATCKTGPADIAAQFAAARAKYKSPLKALVELFVECTGFASTPESMANGLAYLQIDLTDRLIQQVNGGSMLDWAVFREGTLASWVRRDLEALLRPFRSTGRREARRKHPRRSKRGA